MHQQIKLVNQFAATRLNNTKQNLSISSQSQSRENKTSERVITRLTKLKVDLMAWNLEM